MIRAGGHALQACWKRVAGSCAASVRVRVRAGARAPLAPANPKVEAPPISTQNPAGQAIRTCWLGKRGVHVWTGKEGRAAWHETPCCVCPGGATALMPTAAHPTRMEKGAGERGAAGSGGGASKAEGRVEPER